MDLPVTRPDLTRAEWDLLEELVRAELEELAAEIHHTDTRSYREDLQARRDALAHLLARIEFAKAA